MNVQVANITECKTKNFMLTLKSFTMIPGLGSLSSGTYYLFVESNMLDPNLKVGDNITLDMSVLEVKLKEGTGKDGKTYTYKVIGLPTPE